MDNKILEIFIPGPAGRLEAKYYKSKKNTSPIALVLQPHPQYGGTMNNKIVVETFQTFMANDFSVCRVNFRGVGKSDGEFDNGQGELADAAAALDWLERENFDNSQCWVSGFSFGSLIAMQLLMRRPEINRFIAISPQPNVYDFSFLSPCPTSGLMVYGKKDELVPNEYLTDLNKHYVKEPKEDLISISQGIKGDKGNVHINIGSQINFDNNSYEACSSEITSIIKSLYKLHPTNYAAAIIQGKENIDCPYKLEEIDDAIQFLKNRIKLIPEDMHSYYLNQYSNPINSNT